MNDLSNSSFIDLDIQSSVRLDLHSNNQARYPAPSNQSSEIENEFFPKKLSTSAMLGSTAALESDEEEFVIIGRTQKRKNESDSDDSETDSVIEIEDSDEELPVGFNPEESEADISIIKQAFIDPKHFAIFPIVNVSQQEISEFIGSVLWCPTKKANDFIAENNEMIETSLIQKTIEALKSRIPNDSEIFVIYCRLYSEDSFVEAHQDQAHFDLRYIARFPTSDLNLPLIFTFQNLEKCLNQSLSLATPFIWEADLSSARTALESSIQSLQVLAVAICNSL